MNTLARFDENPAMTLRVIKETKHYGLTDTRTDNVKTVYPPQTKFAGAYNNLIKCILKPILSQFDVLSIKNCNHRQVQRFSTGTSKIILV